MTKKRKKSKRKKLGYCYLLEEERKTQEMVADLPKVTQEVDKGSKTKNDISGRNSSYKSLLWA